FISSGDNGSTPSETVSPAVVERARALPSSGASSSRYAATHSGSVCITTPIIRPSPLVLERERTAGSPIVHADVHRLAPLTLPRLALAYHALYVLALEEPHSAGRPPGMQDSVSVPD